MPTSRGRNHVLQASGTTPRRAKTKPMRAAEDALRMSIGSVKVIPKPTAGPLIAAITGFFMSKIRRVTVPPPSRCSSALTARPRAAASNVEPPAPRSAPRRGGCKAGPPGAEISARAERAARAGDDDGAHVVVGVGAVPRLAELAQHRRGDGVEAIRAVQGDREASVLAVVGALEKGGTGS